MLKLPTQDKRALSWAGNMHLASLCSKQLIYHVRVALLVGVQKLQFPWEIPLFSVDFDMFDRAGRK